MFWMCLVVFFALCGINRWYLNVELLIYLILMCIHVNKSKSGYVDMFCRMDNLLGSCKYFGRCLYVKLFSAVMRLYCDSPQRRSGMDHTILPSNNTMPASTS